MKILFHAYNTCCQNTSGGVQIRMRKIRDHLLARGHIVDFFSTFETRIEDYDILHVFALNFESLSIMKVAKEQGLKIVLSSIVNTINGYKIDWYRHLFSKTPIMTTYKLLDQTINLADYIIVETEAEGAFISKHYKISQKIMRVIPNGIDVDNWEGREIFEELPGVKKYVLQCGRFDKNKNQLNVIRALKGSGIDVVFVGGEDARGGDYFESCKREAKGDTHFHFLGWVSRNSPLLRSAFRWADTLVLPSHYETFGLVALEAGIMGAKLVLSNTLPILSYKSMSSCETFNPDNVNEIREAVTKTFSLPQSNKMKNAMITDFSWGTVIDSHESVYNSLL